MKKNHYTKLNYRDTDVVLRITRDVRWIGIATVALFYPLENEHILPVLALIVLSILYNLIQYTKWFSRMTAKISALKILTMDYVLLFILVLLTGGINSPYYFYLGLPLIIAAYWFGRLAVLQLAAISIGSSVVAIIYSLYSPSEVSVLQRAVGYIATLSMIGLLVNRLTISERTQRNVAMLSREQADTERTRLLSLINSMADAVIATDKEGVVSDYNSASLDLLNTNKQLKGQSIQTLFNFQRSNTERFDIIKYAKKQKITMKREDLHFINNNKEKVNLYVSVSRIAPLETNAQEGFIIMLRDITKEKSLDEQRDEFISVASHELRTPLAIAEANISTALLPQLSEKIDPQIRQLLGQAHDNIIFLGKLVKDLTTLAEAEKDVLSVQVAVVNAKDLVEQLLKDYETRAAEKGLQLKLAVEDNLPPIVTSEQHIREILQNFITNALKYTQSGTITLGAQRTPEAPDNLTFSVQDTGIGISTSDQKHLFSKFYRSEDYRTRETGGTGLGLYITQKLAQRLNASIWFESKLNEGSTFYLRVPPFSKLKRDQGQVITAQVDNVLSNI